MERFADDDLVLTDDDLAALALAADPDAPLDADAVPFTLAGDTGDGVGEGLLPEWYMPAATTTVRGRVRRGVVGGVVLALVLINSAGLCVTYGVPELAW